MKKPRLAPRPFLEFRCSAGTPAKEGQPTISVSENQYLISCAGWVTSIW